MGFSHGEKPAGREESIRPALMISTTDSSARSLFLSAQNGSQPAADKSIDRGEHVLVGVLEVFKPPFEHGVQILKDSLETYPPTTILTQGGPPVRRNESSVKTAVDLQQNIIAGSGFSLFLHRGRIMKLPMPGYWKLAAVNRHERSTLFMLRHFLPTSDV